MSSLYHKVEEINDRVKVISSLVSDLSLTVRSHEGEISVGTLNSDNIKGPNVIGEGGIISTCNKSIKVLNNIENIVREIDIHLNGSNQPSELEPIQPLPNDF